MTAAKRKLSYLIISTYVRNNVIVNEVWSIVLKTASIIISQLKPEYEQMPLAKHRKVTSRSS